MEFNGRHISLLFDSNSASGYQFRWRAEGTGEPNIERWQYCGNSGGNAVQDVQLVYLLFFGHNAHAMASGRGVMLTERGNQKLEGARTHSMGNRLSPERVAEKANVHVNTVRPSAPANVA